MHTIMSAAKIPSGYINNPNLRPKHLEIFRKKWKKKEKENTLQMWFHPIPHKESLHNRHSKNNLIDFRDQMKREEKKKKNQMNE